MHWTVRALGVGVACLLAGACGSKGSDEGDDDASTEDDAASSSSADATSNDGSSGVDDASSDGGSSSADTGAGACAAEVDDVSLTVSGLEWSGSIWFEASCTVTEIEQDLEQDAVRFDCQPERGEVVPLRVAYSNAVVTVPNSLVVDDVVDIAYAAAEDEEAGQWLAVRDQDDQRVVIAIVIGGSVRPSADGAPADLFEPIGIGPFGGRCDPGPGVCYALGEPAVLRFMIVNDAAEIEPLSTGTLLDYTIHGGDSWLSDETSEYSCDGPTDDRVRFIMVGA
jgi:hypothetical protein